MKPLLGPDRFYVMCKECNGENIELDVTDDNEIVIHCLECDYVEKIF